MQRPAFTSLRAKVLIILGGVLGLYLVLSFTIQRYVVFPRFVALELTQARQDLARCQEALERETKHLSILCNDWAAWDDTYQFAADPNQEYIKSNLVAESFSDNRLNLIFIYNREGKVLWGEIRDLESMDLLHSAQFSAQGLPPDNPLLKHPAIPGEVSGILLTDLGPMIVVSRPIITSDNQGPSRGAVVMGRLLNPRRVSQLAEQTRVHMGLWARGSEDLPPQYQASRPLLIDPQVRAFSNLGMVSLFRSIPDINGQPAVILGIALSRQISAEGWQAQQVAMYLVLAVGLIMLVLLVIWLGRTVILPVTRLTDYAVSLGRDQEPSESLELDPDDELGILGREFEDMVRRLADTRKRLIEMSYHSGRADMASGVLHNLGNALTPLVVSLDRMNSDLGELPLANLREVLGELCQGEVDDQRRADLCEYVLLAIGELENTCRQLKEGLAGVSGRAQRMEAVLNDFQGYSDQGRPLEPVRPRELIEDALNLVPTGQREGIELAIDPDLDELGSFKLHRTPLMQVLANLVVNAAESIQRSGREDGRIVLWGEVLDSDGPRRLHLAVSDNGAGIAPQDLPRLFDTDFSTKTPGKGGTGLHWSANVVGAMQGDLRAESAGPGRGATFHLYLMG